MVSREDMVGKGRGSAAGAGTRTWDVTTDPTPGVWVELAPAQKYRRGLDSQNMDDLATMFFRAGSDQPPAGNYDGAIEVEAKSLNVYDFSIQDRWWVCADTPSALVRVWEY